LKIFISVQRPSHKFFYWIEATSFFSFFV
jgi:hypothetical protein